MVFYLVSTYVRIQEIIVTNFCSICFDKREESSKSKTKLNDEKFYIIAIKITHTQTHTQLWFGYFIFAT